MVPEGHGGGAMTEELPEEVLNSDNRDVSSLRRLAVRSGFGRSLCSNYLMSITVDVLVRFMVPAWFIKSRVQLTFRELLCSRPSRWVDGATFGAKQNGGPVANGPGLHVREEVFEGFQVHGILELLS
jgi:hypothetical protein